MSVRWPRYLPRFPAILIMPTVLFTWDNRARTHYSHGIFIRGWDWPMEFMVFRDEVWGWLLYGVGQFIIDVSLALATAYLLAMAVDRLVFPLIRRRRRQGPATPPEPS